MVYRVEAIAREADKEAWRFEFDGDEYSLPHDFDMRAAAAFNANDLEGGLRVLLGDEQWERIVASKKVFGVKELRDLLAAYCDGIGVDLGEFAASSSSSRRTATRSKPTSNGSTASRSRTSSRGR